MTNSIKKMLSILFGGLLIIICGLIIFLFKPKQVQAVKNPEPTTVPASQVKPTEPPVLVGSPVTEQVKVDTSDKTDYNKMVYGDNKNRSESVSGVNADGSMDAPAQYDNPASDFATKPQNPETDMANQLMNANQPTPAIVQAVN